MVAERTNPFNYGSPATGESFADRESELDAISERMLNGQNVILLSPRRYGKTSLMLEAIERVRKRRGRSGYASLLLCTSDRDVAETLLSAVLNGPLSWVTSQRQKLGQLLSRVRLQPAMEVDPMGKLRMSLGTTEKTVDWRHVISTVLRLLADAEAGNRPVSLVLDEFQRVAEIDPALPSVFKVMADELRDVSLVFSGSKMHVMQRIAVGPGAPLMGMGEVISLDLIPEEAMVSFLVRRTRAAGKQMAGTVARQLFGLVDGIPNDVQRLAFEAFSTAGSVIDADVVNGAMTSVVAHRAIDYAETFTRLAPAQQRVLKALAREPRAAVSARAFVEEVGVANAASVRTALNALQNEELVARRGEQWTVADTFFRSWLRQDLP